MPKVSQLPASSCAVLTAVRQTYRDCLYFMAKGYICYVLPENKRSYEHRLVFQSRDWVATGQLNTYTLPLGCHIHHLDEHKTNNTLANLMLVASDTHAVLHKTAGTVATCPICQAQFWLKPSRKARAAVNYCSQPCTAAAKRRAVRPSVEELVTQLHQSANFVAIGKAYGVSGNAVRKWCQAYSLPTKTAEWRKE